MDQRENNTIWKKFDLTIFVKKEKKIGSIKENILNKNLKRKYLAI